jgi:hypothetical protein
VASLSSVRTALGNIGAGVSLAFTGIRESLSAIASGVKGAFSVSGEIGRAFGDGFKSIGQALRGQGQAIGQAAGVVLGGALVASFSARLAFGSDNLGDALAGGLGLAASGLGAFAATGSGPLAVAVVGLGTLVAAFQSSAQAARDSAETVRGYVGILEQLGDVSRDQATRALVTQAFRDLDPKVLRTLVGEGITIPVVTDIILSGDNARLAELQERLNDIEGIRSRLARNFNPLNLFKDTSLSDAAKAVGEIFENTDLAFQAQGDLEAAAGKTASALGRVVGVLNAAPGAAAALTEEGKNALSAVRSLGEFLESSAGKAFIARERLVSYFDAGSEVLKGRLEGVNRQLEIATDRARDARDSLIEYLSGPKRDVGADAVTETILEVDRLGQSLKSILEAEGFNLEGVINPAKLESILSGASQTFRDFAISLLDAGKISTRQDLFDAFKPLSDAAAEVGGEAGERILDEILRYLGTIKNDGALEAEIRGVLVTDAVVEQVQRFQDETKVQLEVFLAVRDGTVEDFLLSVQSVFDLFRPSIKPVWDDSDIPEWAKGLSSIPVSVLNATSRPAGSLDSVTQQPAPLASPQGRLNPYMPPGINVQGDFNIYEAENAQNTTRAILSLSSARGTVSTRFMGGM